MSSIDGLPGKVEVPVADQNGMMEEMKRIRKLKMEREVLADPSKAKELMKAESTVTYNAKGTLIQTAGSM